LNQSLFPRDENPPPFNEWILGQMQIAANKMDAVLKIDSDRRGCCILQDGKPLFVWIAGQDPLFAVGNDMMSIGEIAEIASSAFDAITELLKGLYNGDVSDSE
jgi:hypothetical protein